MFTTFRSLSALVLAVGLVGCGGGSPTSPSPVAGPNPTPAPAPAPQNAPPTFSQISLAQSAYRSARLTANVSDPDGQVTMLVINWGDGKQDTVTSGFGSIARTHEYGDAQAFSVALMATDNLGLTSQNTRSVTITVPPEKCVGVRIVDICGRVTSDFSRMNVSLKAVDTVITSFTVNEGTPTISIPLLPFGRLTATFGFNTGRLRLQGEFCAIPLLSCSGLFDETIQF